jgi:tetratricopeptide (TPR) repeat protein
MRSAALIGGGVLLGIAISALGIWLGMYYTMRQVAESQHSSTPDTVLQLVKAGAELQTARTEYERWIALGNVALWNVDAGAFDQAKTYAEELLAQSEKYKSDWNYGNAIHKGNLALGRIELRRGNKTGAKAYLLAAGKTRGSPQLDSFGPNMLLAKELLEAGERETVLEYFRLCGEFWKADVGALVTWRQLVEKGRIPNFGPNLLY